MTAGSQSRLAARNPQVIRVDSLWLAIEPLDMHAGNLMSHEHS